MNLCCQIRLILILTSPSLPFEPTRAASVPPVETIAYPDAKEIKGDRAMKLTKAQIVEQICTRNGFSRKQSLDCVETLMAIVKGSLAAGEDVLISGFGRFCVKQKRQRLGRNPATKKPMMLDARRVVTFKCSGKLRKVVNDE